MRTNHWRAGLLVTTIVLLAACAGESAGTTDSATTMTSVVPTSAPSSETTTSATGSDDWAEVVAAAEEEGQVVVYYVPAQEQIQPLVDGFEAAYPAISVLATTGSTSDLRPRVETERDTGVDGADVFITTERQWFQGVEGDLLPVGPSADSWPAEAYMVPGKVPVGSKESVSLLLWNTDLVTEPLTGYDDLLRPEFQGQIGVLELRAVVAAAFYAYLEEMQGEGFLEELAAQEPRVYPSGVGLMQAVPAGEISVGAFGAVPIVEQLKSEGAPLDYLIMEPSLGIEFGVGALGWSQRPNAAQVFLDYAMSEEGQALWHSTGATESALPIDGAIPTGTIGAFDPAAFPPDVLDAWIARFAELFQ